MAQWRDSLEDAQARLFGHDKRPLRAVTARLTLPVREGRAPTAVAAGLRPMSNVASAQAGLVAEHWFEGLEAEGCAPRDGCRGELFLCANAAGEAAVLGAIAGRLAAERVALKAAEQLLGANDFAACSPADRRQRSSMVRRFVAKRGLSDDLAVVLMLRVQLSCRIGLAPLEGRVRRALDVAALGALTSSGPRATLVDLALCAAEQGETGRALWDLLAPLAARACSDASDPTLFASLTSRAPLDLLAELVIDRQDQHAELLATFSSLALEDGEAAHAALGVHFLSLLPPYALSGCIEIARQRAPLAPWSSMSVARLVAAHADLLCMGATAHAQDQGQAETGALAMMLQLESAAEENRLEAGGSSVEATARALATRLRAAEVLRELERSGGEGWGNARVLLSHWGCERGWSTASAARQVLAVANLSSRWSAGEVFALLQIIGHSSVSRYPGAARDARVTVLEWAADCLEPSSLSFLPTLLDALFFVAPDQHGRHWAPPFQEQVQRLRMAAQACRTPFQWRGLELSLAAFLARIGRTDHASELFDRLLALPAAVREQVACELAHHEGWPRVPVRIRLDWLQARLDEPERRGSFSLDTPSKVLAGVRASHRQRWQHLLRTFRGQSGVLASLETLALLLAHGARRKRHAADAPELALVSTAALEQGSRGVAAVREHERGRCERPPRAWARATDGDLLRMLALATRRARARNEADAMMENTFVLLCASALGGRGKEDDDGRRAWRDYALSFAWRLVEGRHGTGLTRIETASDSASS